MDYHVNVRCAFLSSLGLHHWAKGLLIHCGVFCDYEFTKTFLGMYKICGVFTLFRKKRKQKSLQGHRTLSVSGQRNHIYSHFPTMLLVDQISALEETILSKVGFWSNLFWKECGQQAFCSFLPSYLPSFLPYFFPFFIFDWFMRNKVLEVQTKYYLYIDFPIKI